MTCLFYSSFSLYDLSVSSHNWDTYLKNYWIRNIYLKIFLISNQNLNHIDYMNVQIPCHGSLSRNISRNENTYHLLCILILWYRYVLFSHYNNCVTHRFLFHDQVLVDIIFIELLDYIWFYTSIFYMLLVWVEYNGFLCECFRGRGLWELDIGESPQRIQYDNH